MSQHSDFGVAQQSDLGVAAHTAQHDDFDHFGVTAQHNNFTQQDDFAWSNQQDSFAWADPDLLNGQMSCDEMSCLDESPNCKGPCLSNQQNQKEDNRELMDDAYSCGPAQGDWEACAPAAAVDCIPTAVNPTTTPPPPLCRDLSNVSLCSNLSFGSLTSACDMNVDAEYNGNDSDCERLSLSPLSIGSYGNFDSDIEI